MTRTEHNTMVWIDLETTGLNAELEVPLELGIIVTDNELNELCSWSRLVRCEGWEEVFKQADEWVIKTHTESGLVGEIRALPYLERAGTQLLSWSPNTTSLLAYQWLREQGIPEGLPLCGSTVGFDRSFMKRHFSFLEASFGYRNIDVSSFSEACKLFNPGLYRRTAEIPEFDKKNAKHRVLDDIRYSIKKMQFFAEEFLFYAPEVLSEDQPTLPELDQLTGVKE